ncbi:FAD-dependent oxidoreductase [Saccharopolyspora sp. NPDC047091]|uniref:NAD(P)/FAD-dependent oxidoreductase n=1 Tax=Saccharopolyspora sp. NPDC047091 TaxID=3155924 RepID=UPI0033EFBDE7
MSAGRIAVIGASAAGLTAAEQLRRSGWDGEIALVGAEPHLPYDRPPLSKQVLAGAWEPDRTGLRAADALAGLDLDLRLGTRATGLDVADRRVLLGADALDCDGVVIATGVAARALPEQSPGAHVLRTLDDALALRAPLAVPGRRLVVVGAGVLGAEVAAVARELGHEVVLVAPEQVPMERAIGAEAGALLAAAHRAHGVDLRLGESVTGLVHEEGRTVGVRLAGGEEITGDAVLVAIGSRPAVDWLAGSGLDVADGVGCDEFCAAAPGIYAAGDVARWPHPVLGRALRVEHRMNATEQGMAAARNLLAELAPDRFGERSPFAPVPYFWSDQYRFKVQAFGDLDAPDEVLLRVLDGTDPAAPKAAALYRRGGAACGALTIGVPPKPTRALRTLVATPHPWDEAATALQTLPT